MCSIIFEHIEEVREIGLSLLVLVKSPHFKNWMDGNAPVELSTCS